MDTTKEFLYEKLNPFHQNISDMQVVILAGGLATRLRPLTDTVPKSLIPIEGVPFIHYQVSKLIQSGFSKFLFCVGYLSESIIEYLNSLQKWRRYFTYSKEKEPLGTGGALLNAYSLLEDDFIVLNGDNIWLGNYRSTIAYYDSIKSQALVVLHRVEHPGNVRYDSDSSKIVHYVRNCSDCDYEDIGVKIFNKNIFAGYSQNYPISLEDDIYHSLITQNKLDGLLSFDNVLDIGDFEALKSTEQKISTLNHEGLK